MKYSLQILKSIYPNRLNAKTVENYCLALEKLEVQKKKQKQIEKDLKVINEIKQVLRLV